MSVLEKLAIFGLALGICLFGAGSYGQSNSDIVIVIKSLPGITQLNPQPLPPGMPRPR